MRLAEQVKIHNKNLQTMEEDIVRLMSYLSSPKFHGIENNYVNASEMYIALNELRNKLASWKELDIIK
jgi:hypothetical protein